MKTFPKLIVFTATLGLGALTSLAHAQTAAATPAVPTDNSEVAPADHPARMHRGRRGDRLQMLAKQLDLTADQKAKLKPVFEDSRKQMEALRKDESLTREQKRDRMMEIGLATRKQVRAVLTPEQQTKFDAMRERMEERRGK